MATTFTWDFTKCVVAPSLDGLSEVVTSMTGTLTAANADGVSLTVDVSFNLELDLDAEFVPWADLTPEILSAWADGRPDGPALKVNLDADLAAKVAAMASPPEVRSPPWVPAEDAPAG